MIDSMSLLGYLKMRYHLFLRLYNEYLFLLKTLGSFNTNDSQNKQRESIIMQTHVIEKGLSLNEIKFGFGVPKILNLLKELREYNKLYNDSNTLFFSLSVIEAYIQFHKQNSQSIDYRISDLYHELSQQCIGAEQMYGGGTIQLTKKEIIDSLNSDFGTFAKKRHSLRQFTGEAVGRELIECALKIAETTPSACNRQPWRNYVFTKRENINKILDIQGGARQFKETVSAVVVITATPNAFFDQEYHQHFVNGGLYAMNLLYAIHSQGLGAIPLNGGISKERVRQIMEMCNSEDQYELIMLIAIGQMPDDFSVAKSARIKYSYYTYFD